jgi:transposase
MSNITVIGIDLAKTVFQVCGLNQANKRQFNISVKRAKLVSTVRQHPNATIAMEACGSSHHWGRVFTELGYQVKMIPPQFVKSFCRGNKNDALDALAIAEASMRPDMHCVTIKTIEQQDYQTLLRGRTRLIEQRTATINQARGTLAEYGLILPTSVAAFKRGIPEVLEDANNDLTPIMRAFIHSLYEDYQTLTARIDAFGRQLAAIANNHSIMRSLLRLRGIGPISAVAIYASIGNGSQFTHARQLAAWIGLVPKQHGTGGITRLGSISKRGNRYLRLLLIHGARTVMNWMKNKTDDLSLWAKQLIERRGRHKAIVALANKTARMIWVVLNRGIDNVPVQHLSTV